MEWKYSTTRQLACMRALRTDIVNSMMREVVRIVMINRAAESGTMHEVRCPVRR